MKAGYIIVAAILLYLIIIIPWTGEYWETDYAAIKSCQTNPNYNCEYAGGPYAAHDIGPLHIRHWIFGLAVQTPDALYENLFAAMFPEISWRKT